MSINAIYACKLFKASSNKDKIRAAASNPINAELVQQLSEYLDDEYLEKSVELDDVSSEEPKEEPKDEPEEHIRPSESSGKQSSGPAPSGPSHTGMDTHLSDKLAESKANESEGGDTAESKSPEPTKTEDVGEATKIAKSKVLAATDYSKELNSIVGLLNATEDTAGVCRGVVKEDELWLHYKDSINLNNVMEPVIALINASDYSTLNFNRLARTENAIVFSISESSKYVESIQEIEDEKK